VSRHLVRQAAFIGANLFAVGRAHRCDPPSGGGGGCLLLLLDAVAIRSRSVGPARRLSGGAVARILPDVRNSGGGDGAGARSADGAAAHRCDLPGVARPPVPERGGGRPRAAGERKSILRISGVPVFRVAWSRMDAGRIPGPEPCGATLVWPPLRGSSVALGRDV